MKTLTESEIAVREQYVLDTLTKVVVANTRILFNRADLDCALVNIQRAFDKATSRNQVSIVYGHPVYIMNPQGWTDRSLSEIAKQMGEWNFDEDSKFPLTATEMEYCARHIGIDTGYILEDGE